MNEFRKARVTLTLWYILICTVMLAIFSFAAVHAEKQAFSKIEAVFGNPIERPYLSNLLSERLDNFGSDFLSRLIIFDVILLGFSAGASWFLSGKTLKPIQTMIKNQEDFAADVSHELRTPLTTVNMEIEAMKRTQVHIPKGYLIAFNSIQDEIKRMNNLVEGLLLVVRTNNKPVHFEVIDASTITKETCNKLKLLAQEKQIHLTHTIEKELMIRIDKDELKRIETIFIDNAIRYTPKKGSIWVDFKKIDNKAVLTVTDTGTGISQKDIPHIFERFYRASAENTLHNEYKGTGLGLSIATQILKQSRGNVSVKSQPGKGSTFTIDIPLSS